jgi:23S rRNA pseudouridine2604 synthase
VQNKRVKINGKIADIGTRVAENDRVLVDGKPLTMKKKQVYIILNKPVGITCTTERHIKGNIIDFVGHQERIFPIGRLDKDSEGLIILTSDGGIVNEILREENHHEKEYVVVVDKKISNDFLMQMASGVTIFNPVKHVKTRTKPCKVEAIDDVTFRIILAQGLNRQIRRMCEVLGYKVVKLKRTRIMHIKLGKLKTGEWRTLSQAEVGGLMKSSKGSF